MILFSITSQLTPFISKSDTGSLPISDRNCLFSHESDALSPNFYLESADLPWHEKARLTRATAHLLKNFSTSGCQFECTLQWAYHQCHCVPWNFPWHDTFVPFGTTQCLATRHK